MQDIACEVFKVKVAIQVPKEYIKALRPKQTFLVHLSGHEDRPGPGYDWDDKTWGDEAERVFRGERPYIPVRVPEIEDEYEI